ncbi:hypothetical protein EII17_07375 [Clostridiales bacterium COT073_COT-073]|nr:hypothetical protein EII17_07375 [Clostridiales bacterium COT073_COT-073]
MFTGEGIEYSVSAVYKRIRNLVVTKFSTTVSDGKNIKMIAIKTKKEKLTPLVTQLIYQAGDK